MKLLHYLVIHKHAKLSYKSSTSFKDRTAAHRLSFSQPVAQLVFFDKLHASKASAYSALMMPQKIAEGYFAPRGENKHRGEGYFQVHEGTWSSSFTKVIVCGISGKRKVRETMQLYRYNYFSILASLC